MLDLSGLTQELNDLRSVKAGVLALIAKLKENAGDPVALKALVDQFDAESNEIAAAVAANTPAA